MREGLPQSVEMQLLDHEHGADLVIPERPDQSLANVAGGGIEDQDNQSEEGGFIGERRACHGRSRRLGCRGGTTILPRKARQFFFSEGGHISTGKDLVRYAHSLSLAWGICEFAGASSGLLKC